jgi:hypothetical protein
MLCFGGEEGGVLRVQGKLGWRGAGHLGIRGEDECAGIAVSERGGYMESRTKDETDRWRTEGRGVEVSGEWKVSLGWV